MQTKKVFIFEDAVDAIIRTQREIKTNYVKQLEELFKQHKFYFQSLDMDLILK